MRGAEEIISSRGNSKCKGLEDRKYVACSKMEGGKEGRRMKRLGSF